MNSRRIAYPLPPPARSTREGIGGVRARAGHPCPAKQRGWHGERERVSGREWSRKYNCQKHMRHPRDPQMRPALLAEKSPSARSPHDSRIQSPPRVWPINAGQVAGHKILIKSTYPACACQGAFPNVRSSALLKCGGQLPESLVPIQDSSALVSRI